MSDDTTIESLPPHGEPLQRVDVAVVGAGLAGLTAARLLQGQGCTVTVVDSQPAGGRGRTDERRGFLFNRGPHALYLGGEAARVLAQLGMHPAGGPPSSNGAGVVGGRVGVLPGGASSLLRTSLLGARSKVAAGRLLAGLPKVRAADLGDTSFASWLDGQRLPADARLLVEAVARVSSYSNAPEIVAADMVVGQIQLALGQGVRYVHGGWQTIVDALADGLDVRRLTAVHVGRDAGDVVVSTAEGVSVVAAAVVLAAGTPTATAALLDRSPFDVGPPIEAACLDLGTTRAASPGLLLGLDVPLYLSSHSPAARLAADGQFVVHAARYLAPGDDAAPAAQQAELAAHAALGGITEGHITEQRYQHRMTVAGALPIAAHGGLRGRPAATASGVDGVFLAGDWVGSRGHLLDASLASAEDAVAAAVRLVRR
jgi:glycine/D-amino acid oxidase-like deaminating enzyme